MNRFSKVFSFIFAGAILLVPPAFAEDTATGTAVLNGLNKENTKSALEGAYDEQIVRGTELATKDKVGEGVKQLGEASKADAEELRAKMAVDKQKLVKEPQNKLVQQSTKGMTPEMKANRAQLIKKGDALIKEGDKVIEDSKSAGGWCSKVGKVLDVINVVAVGAQAAGYAAEGDMNGASGVVVSETTKRVTTAAGALAGAFTGGHCGAIIGAAAAEEFHGAVTQKIIEKNVDIARNNLAKEKMQGNGLAPVQIMTPSGTRTLPNDMTLDKETGNIVRKTPDQLQADREKAQQEFRDRESAAKSTSPLDIAAEKLKRGEITQAQFDKEIDSFNNPNQVPPVDEDESEGEEGTTDGQGEGDEGQSIEEADPVDPKAVAEAKDIPPVQVRATVSYDGDYSYQEFKNIVHTVVTLTFWNVGSLVPSYGGVKVHMTNTASLNGVSETVEGGGTFTGGPNGKFYLTVGGKNVKGKLANGTTVTYAGKQGNVENPNAFLAWVK